MNHKHEPDNNAMFESESPDTSKQLDALELQLKAFRPQPSQLNAAALLRESDEHIVQRGGSIARRSLWLGSSWACGAAIGAAVMFVVMSVRPDSVPMQRPTPVAAPPPSAPIVNSSSLAKQEPIETSDPFSMLAIDLFNDSPSSYLAEGRPLQVGMYLRRNHRFVDQPHLTNRLVEEPDHIQDERQSMLTMPLAPRQPVTRERLMRELLEESGGSVL